MRKDTRLSPVFFGGPGGEATVYTLISFIQEKQKVFEERQRLKQERAEVLEKQEKEVQYD